MGFGSFDEGQEDEYNCAGIEAIYRDSYQPRPNLLLKWRHLTKFSVSSNRLCLRQGGN